MPSPGHSLNRPGAPASKAGLLTLLALVLLGLVAMGVVFILPSIVDTAAKNPPKTPPMISPTKKISEQVPPIPPTVRTDNPTAPPPTGPNRESAELLLSEALKRQARLENEGVKIWGETILETSYPEAQAVLAKASDDFDNQRILPALGGFQNAITLFDRLGINKNKRYQRAITAGREAIERHDSDEAAKQYRIAQAVRPGDTAATAGLTRAQNLPLVLAKMAVGQNHESSDNLNRALQSYRAAATLDSAYAPAQVNADRVASLIKERAYQQAVSTSLAALAINRLRDAERALKEAAQIKPKASEIRDLRRRIRLGRQLTTLNRLRKQAENHESKEQWEEAGKSYDKALRVDRSATFAVRGRALAQKYVDLHAQLESYLSAPERLRSPEPLAHAKQVLAAAEAVTTAGPRLKDSRDRLRLYISESVKPRPVLIQSDEKTSVTVYRVGRFGAFREKRLDLRPGDYTAVGSRPGYRDVRVRFRVGPTETENIVVIKCTDRI